MTLSRVTFASGSRRNSRCRSTTTNTASTTTASRINFFTAVLLSAPEPSRSLLLFVILLFSIDAPQRALVYVPGGDAVHHRHRRQHGVVLVVVLMHTVAAHQKQVFEAVRPSPQLVETVIGAKVGWVRLRHSHYMSVEHVGRLQYSNLLQLRGRKLLQLFIRHRPQRVGFVAEILQPYPYFGSIRNHIRTPVIEYLQTSE